MSSGSTTDRLGKWVVKYRRKFIELLVPLGNLLEKVLRGQLVNGLKEDGRVKIRLLIPRTLDLAMDLAIRAEDKIKCFPFHKNT